MGINGGIGLYLLKILAYCLSWLLQKSLCTVVIALLITGMVIGSAICLPLLLLVSLRKQCKKHKNETYGND
jgi:hypothetical protein